MTDMTARTAPPRDLAAADSPSGAQVDFLRNLLDERDLNGKSRIVAPAIDGRALVSKYEDGILTKSEASTLISWLKSLPSTYNGQTTAGRDADLPDVPSGRYAIKRPGKPLKFYRVKRPTDGKWKGWTFVDEQRSNEFYPVRGLKFVRPILEAIVKDPREAAQTYGREIKRCCKCGRKLTNEVSRHYGIGPICAGRSGWFDDQRGQSILSQLKLAGE